MKKIIIVDVPEGYKLTQELAILNESGKFDVKTVKFTEFIPPTNDVRDGKVFRVFPGKDTKSAALRGAWLLGSEWYKNLLQ